MATITTNGSFIDGSGGKLVLHAAIAIKDKKIVFVGQEKNLPKFEGEVSYLDASGDFILPGFIETHVHMMLEYEPVAIFKD